MKLEVDFIVDMRPRMRDAVTSFCDIRFISWHLTLLQRSTNIISQKCPNYVLHNVPQNIQNLLSFKMAYMQFVAVEFSRAAQRTGEIICFPINNW